jgi:monoamine oxidase
MPQRLFPALTDDCFSRPGGRPVSKRRTQDRLLQASLSRRDFLGAAAFSSAAFALGCGGSGGDSVPVPRTGLEFIIIGAGVSGLIAGQELKKAGRTFAIIEAQDHVGGRAFTDNSFPVPFDHGAQWFTHVIPDGPGKTLNPLFDRANKSGVATLLDLLPRYMYDGTQKLPDEAILPAEEMFLTFGTLFQSAGLQASLGATDLSITQATAALAGMPWYDFAWGVTEAERGTSPDTMSSLDIYKYNSRSTVPFGLPNTESYLVPGGLGNYIATFADGLPIQLSTAATNVTWDKNGGVEVDTTAGKMSAQAVIVTCPTSVIASGKMTFTPALPDPYRTAYENLPMGPFAKIGLAFDSDVFAGLGMSYVTSHEDTKVQPSMLVNVFGAHQCSVFLGGAKCAEVQAMGEQALIEFAIEYVVKHFGSSARNAVSQSSVHPWGLQEWIGGAASVATPGHAPDRLKLMNPLNNRVFFAGEAVSEFAAGSIVGAYEAAQMAVSKALATVQ